MRKRHQQRPISRDAARKFHNHWIAVSVSGKVVRADKSPKKLFEWLEKNKHEPVTVSFLRYPTLPYAYLAIA